MGEAASEFGKHRDVINGVAEEIQTTKKEIGSMTVGLREELDEIKARLLSVSSTTGSGSPAAAASGELRSELDAMAAELVKLR